VGFEVYQGSGLYWTDECIPTKRAIDSSKLLVGLVPPYKGPPAG
jgi:hypothetical protein